MENVLHITLGKHSPSGTQNWACAASAAVTGLCCSLGLAVVVRMALSQWCWKANSESQMSFCVPNTTSMDESPGCSRARMGFSYSLNDSVMPVAPLYVLGRTHGISSIGDPICLECHAWFWCAKWHLFLVWLINCYPHYLLQCLVSFYKPQDRAHIHLENEIGSDSNSEGISVECKWMSDMNTPSGCFTASRRDLQLSKVQFLT